MQWLWDLKRKGAEIAAQARQQSDDIFNQNRYQNIGGLLGGNVKTETYGSSHEFDEQGNPINVQNQPSVFRNQGYGFRGSDMGPDAQTDLLAGLMTKGGLNQQQALGLLSTQLGPGAAQALKPSEQLDMVNKLRTPYEKAMLPSRKALTNYNSAVDLMEKAEFTESNMLTGAESVALTKKYLKQVLPDESVMGDDIATLLKSQGLPEYMKSFLQSIVGSGTMSKQGASEVMRAMQTMADSEGVNRDRTRKQYTEEAGQYSLPTTFMGERIETKANPLSFAEWKKSRGF